MTTAAELPLWQALLARARRTPQIALLQGSRRQLDARTLVTAVEHTAETLRRSGVRRLALRADNGVAWVVIDLACQLAGVPLVPLAPYFSPQQSRHALQAAGCDALAAAGPRWPGSPLEAKQPAAGELAGLPFWRLPATAAPVPAGTAKITFSSGSTGAPKGVCLSAEHPQRVADSLAQMIALPGVRHLCLLPLATLLENVGGIYAPLLSDGNVQLPALAEIGLAGSGGLDLRRLTAAIDRHQPHSLILVPALLQALLAAMTRGWRPPRSLRFVAVGGARVAPAQIIAARRGGLPVYEGYGLSECASVVSLNTPGADRPGSAGRPLAHLQLRARDGELEVGGSGFLGYLGAPHSDPAAVVRTGDLGHLDDAGFVHVHGRRDNLIVTAFGRNVSPEWVETELLAGPLLREAVVFGSGQPYCVALLGAPPASSDAAIDTWVRHANASLPEHARIGAWARLPEPLRASPGLLTGNGRPRRAAIAHHYAAQLASLYRQTVEPCPS
jgi:long-subunit acyl-CoA synthetase (AMP-forming)